MLYRKPNHQKARVPEADSDGVRGRPAGPFPAGVRQAAIFQRRAAPAQPSCPGTFYDGLLCLAAIFGSAVLLSACGQMGGPTEGRDMPGVDPERGRQAMLRYGCATCHTIPGVPGAHGTVGPPLTSFAKRDYIAGALSNTPDNLTYWIQHPQAVLPGTAMPELGVSEPEAREIAAYLYTLQ